jgi:hypothetical protein
LLLFSILYYFAIHPKISSAIKLKGVEYNKVIEEQKKLKDQLAYLLAAEEAKKSITDQDIQKMDYIISNDPNIPQLLTSLENIASSSGVFITGIDFSLHGPQEDVGSQIPAEGVVLEPVGNGIPYVEIGLSVQAMPYDGFKDFLDKIEKNIRIMDVVGIIYNPSGTDYSLVIRAYYLK